MNKILGALAIVTSLGTSPVSAQITVDFREQFVRVMDCKEKQASITFESSDGVQQTLNFKARSGEEIERLREESGTQSFIPLLPEYIRGFIKDCLTK